MGMSIDMDIATEKDLDWTKGLVEHLHARLLYRSVVHVLDVDYLHAAHPYSTASRSWRTSVAILALAGT